MPQMLEELEGTSFVTVKNKTCLLLSVHTQTGLLFFHLTQARLPTSHSGHNVDQSISMHKILSLSPLTSRAGSRRTDVSC